MRDAKYRAAPRIPDVMLTTYALLCTVPTFDEMTTSAVCVPSDMDPGATARINVSVHADSVNVDSAIVVPSSVTLV
ncbi:hypothetical protein, partial [Pseudomonas sp. FW305-122]|uniref:hypothetical protein n=1 Tax=Pseudomonas sp. FW305-122 TaxID=2070561 RepID=UPI0011AED782